MISTITAAFGTDRDGTPVAVVRGLLDNHCVYTADELQRMSRVLKQVAIDVTRNECSFQHYSLSGAEHASDTPQAD